MSTTTTPRPTASRSTVPAGTVVVGVDGSSSGEQALAWAVEQALLERRPLTLAHAVESTLNPHGDLAAAERVVDRAADDVARMAPGLQVHRVTEAVDPRVLLLELSQDAAMVVVGSRGLGPVRSLLLGSVGVAVTRHAKCPVLVHRPTRRGVVRKGVVVGVDNSTDATDVLDHAYRIASQRGLPLTVVHTFYDLVTATLPVDGAQQVDERMEQAREHRREVARVMAGLEERYPDVRATVEIARGLPEAALESLAERMDLVVVGSHHGGWVSAVLRGSVTTAVLEHVHCPVLVVPH